MNYETKFLAGLTAFMVLGGGMLAANRAGLEADNASLYMDNPVVEQAEAAAHTVAVAPIAPVATPTPVIEEVTEIEGDFLDIKYFLDGNPWTTNGTATFNSETNTLAWYNAIPDGNFKGHKYHQICKGGIHFENNRASGMSCSVNKDANGNPSAVTVTDPVDGFRDSSATFQF